MSQLGKILLMVISILLILNLYQNITASCKTSSSSSLVAPTPITSLPVSLNDTLPSTNDLTNPRSGYFPNWNNGTIIDRSSLDDASKQIVPKRVIAVFGLESSGTTFVQRTLANALGATRTEGPETVTTNDEIRIQHLSLPTGWISKNDPNFLQRFESLPIVPVFVPKQCRQMPSKSPSGFQKLQLSPPECHVLFGREMIRGESRYFVNVTSHTLFYQQHGIDATAVLVMRDPALHFKGITKKHCPNQTAAFEQFQTGRQILQEAMEKLDPTSVLVVSYETLMTLRDVYMKEIYKALGIVSDYMPEYQNGNIDYISKDIIPQSIAEKLKEDKGIPNYVTIPKNMYEAKSLKEVRAEQQAKNQSVWRL